MGVAKSDFLRCVGADLDLSENAERLARISLDLSDFEKESNHCVSLFYFFNFKVNISPPNYCCYFTTIVLQLFSFVQACVCQVYIK